MQLILLHSWYYCNSRKKRGKNDFNCFLSKNREIIYIEVRIYFLFFLLLIARCYPIFLYCIICYQTLFIPEPACKLISWKWYQYYRENNAIFTRIRKRRYFLFIFVNLLPDSRNLAEKLPLPKKRLWQNEWQNTSKISTNHRAVFELYPEWQFTDNSLAVSSCSSKMTIFWQFDSNSSKMTNLWLFNDSPPSFLSFSRPPKLLSRDQIKPIQ